MNSVLQKEFMKFIKILNDNDCIKHLILIGSWSEYIYMQTGMLKDFIPSIRTLDIDFLVTNLKKPKEKISLTEIAKAEGYFINEDVLTGSTKISSTSQLEIEFLINQKGKGTESVLKTNLGVNAQALRHMNVLIDNTIEVKFLGVLVIVPTPEAYALHKMIINKERGNKIEKDKESLIFLYPYLDKNVVAEIRSTLTKKENRNIDQFIHENLINI
ncbi:MAG: hypothetical protein JJE03_04630 [Peptostreptococcaceae bacterium]|nr:hypothetical protein [Peptostreptococcaceae bacterium]